MSLLSEIHEQPAVLARLFDEQRGAAEAVVTRWRREDPTHVVIAARGTSDNAARYAQYLWGTRLGLTVSLATPSLFAPPDTGPDAAPGAGSDAGPDAAPGAGSDAGPDVGLEAWPGAGDPPSPPRLSGAAVVGISQSGASPDLVAVLEEGRRQGRPTLAITNEPDSPLAEVADQVLPLGAGPERAVAATKTYTAQLGAIALIASCGAPRGQDAADLAALPDAVARACRLDVNLRSRVEWRSGSGSEGPVEPDSDPEMEHASQGWRELSSCAVLGRGTGLATAFEWGLKLQELAYVVAQAASVADFAHGPRAVVEPGFPILGVATRGPRFDELRQALADLRDRGARTLVLTDDPEGVAEVADEILPVPAGVATWLKPIVEIVPAQRWCRAVALARGHDPESPRGLSKVTLTR